MGYTIWYINTVRRCYCMFVYLKREDDPKGKYTIPVAFPEDITLDGASLNGISPLALETMIDDTRDRINEIRENIMGMLGYRPNQLQDMRELLSDASNDLDLLISLGKALSYQLLLYNILSQDDSYYVEVE